MSNRWNATVLTIAISLVALASEPPNLYDVQQQIRAYHASGEWDRDIQRVLRGAAAAVRRHAVEKGKRAIVLDIDETSLSNWEIEDKENFAYDPVKWKAWEQSGKATAIAGTLRFYKLARSKGYAVFFVTGRRESAEEREGTAANLKKAGYSAWEGLYLRAPDDHGKTVVPYKSGARANIEKRGYRIVANVGDQFSDLKGGHAMHTFKLPNPMYFIK